MSGTLGDVSSKQLVAADVEAAEASRQGYSGVPLFSFSTRSPDLIDTAWTRGGTTNSRQGYCGVSSLIPRRILLGKEP
jgi:hypothetical protein